ncbi:MAG: hypothetical protein Hens3KO_04630 [Henriciella sp.]
MTLTPAFIDLAKRQGGRLYTLVVSRDNVHLSPPLLSRAAAARLRAGIRVLEAFLRRVILLLALELEPSLRPDPRPLVTYARLRKARAFAPCLRIFSDARDWPGIDLPLSPENTRGPHPFSKVPAEPMLASLSHLKTLLAAPETRARRLAFYLARYRPGLLAPPGLGQRGVPSRYGSEPGTLYLSMGTAIIKAGRHRPPWLGPRPRAGPRIRCL